MNVVYFSNGQRGIVCLRDLLRSAHRIRGVVASGADPELERVCVEHDLPLHIEPKPNTPVFADRLASMGADVFVCSGYNRILQPLIFTIPPRGTLNLHGGRLPDYRGAAPINWQIINGEVMGGCCVLFMDEGIDTGPVARQELYPIGEDDTHQSVLDRTLEIFPRLLREVLQEMDAGTLKVAEQDRDEGCHYSRRFPEDSRIHWCFQTDREIHNLVRGMQGPYPHAFTERHDEKMEIERTTLLGETVKGIPGRVVQTKGDGVIVICRNRGILLNEIHFRGTYSSARQVIKVGEKFR
jgi:methionyl-tRNA formyltransferase